MPVEYDHELEKPALERTLGVPLYQDQLAELAVHVAGMTPIEGDRMRRASPAGTVSGRCRSGIAASLPGL